MSGATPSAVWQTLTRVLGASVLASVVIVAGTGGTADAARDPVAKVTISRTEIIVYEDPSSRICQVFRRVIVPGYMASGRGAKVPMRFIDITTMTSDTPGLTRPIDTVPTAVVMQDGRELGRIVGYWGPEAFGRLVSGTIGPVE